MPPSKEDLACKYGISADDFDVLTALALRPVRNWRNGNYLGAYPARTLVKHKPVDPAAHAAFSAEIRELAPECR